MNPPVTADGRCSNCGREAKTTGGCCYCRAAVYHPETWIHYADGRIEHRPLRLEWMKGMFLLVALLLCASGCTIYQQLQRAHVAVEAADKIALDEFGKRCMDAAKACKGRKPEECPGWVACDGTRVKYLAAAKAIDESLALVNRLLREMGVK